MKVYTIFLMGQHFHSQFFLKGVWWTILHHMSKMVLCKLVSSCTDCMPSCLKVVETRQSRQYLSLGSVIDCIEFGGIMGFTMFLSNRYPRHCKEIFEGG